MAEADLGVRVFLIDNLSSPMGLITGSVAALGSMLMSGIPQAEALGARMEQLGAKQAELTAAFNSGQMSLQDYNAAMAANQAEMDATTAQMGALNMQLMLVGATLGAAIDFGLFAEGIKSADQAASDLTNTLNNLSIAGNLNDAQLASMKQYLMQVANASIYTADEVGQGFSLLVEKGYQASDVTKGLGQDAINLSMAIGTQGQGTTGAVNLLATAMEVFRAKASESAHYADLLKYAFYNGIPSVDGLRSAFEQVGGRAAMLKIPVDQVVVALDSLGRAGMTGQQAGASLNYALQSLYAPILKTQHELEYLGIITVEKHVAPQLEALSAKFRAVGASMPKFDGTAAGLEDIFKAAQKAGAIPLSTTFYQWAIDNKLLKDAFYDTKGNAKDLMTTLDILYQKIKGMNPEQQAAAFQQLFNVRSGQGISQLMSALGKLDQAYQKLKKSNDAHGQAADAASKQMKSQSNQWKALQTSITDFMALAGQPIQDFFQHLFAGLNKLIGGFTTGGPAVHQFFTTFLVAGLILSGVALGIGLVAIAVFALDGALLPIIIIVLAVSAGIALLAAGIAFFVNWVKSTPAALKMFHGLMDIVGGVVKMVAKFFMDMMRPALKELQDAWKHLMVAVQPILPILLDVGKILLALAGGIILAVVLGAIVALRVAIWVITKVIDGMAYAITNAGHIFSWLGTVGHTVAQALTTNWNNATSQIGGFFNGLGTHINNFVQGAFQWGVNLIQGFINGIKSMIGNVGSAVSNIAGTVKNFLGFHSPTKEGPGSDAHTWAPSLMSMFIHGIISGTPALGLAAHGAAGALAGGFLSPAMRNSQSSYASASASINGANTVVPINIDGHTITTVVLDRLSGQLQMSGTGRTLR